MSEDQIGVKQYDQWMEDNGDAAALTMRQLLEPMEGKDAVIFPPTYLKPKSVKEEDWTGYNIDRFDDGTSVCQIDSVGSQANRMEPLFKRKEYEHLVPQVVIDAGTCKVHLLDAGHRAADAIVLFSTLGPKLYEAFRAYQENGNALLLAKIAPTSIVFGSWDSRSTQAKLPRIVRSVIRAYDVKELRRSAQYSTIAGKILADDDVEVKAEGPNAELGLAHVPAVQTHGGVLVQGEIRREAILNLSALRTLAGPPDIIEDTLKLRRYVFGLALVSFTAPMEPCLREGCELVPDPKRAANWTLVKYDGTRVDLVVTHDEAIAFATAAAASFGVTKSEAGSFDSSIAKEVLALEKADRKKLLRQGPVTREAIEALEKKGKNESKVDAKR
ncbi:MAG: type I-U CRISPR-associated protein Cas7 [Armatimonadetes bacterium]|nr:type I-U CRISPR-associated protein Cas7 [Armatimonadota bacterium]